MCIRDRDEGAPPERGLWLALGDFSETRSGTAGAAALAAAGGCALLVTAALLVLTRRTRGRPRVSGPFHAQERLVAADGEAETHPYFAYPETRL